MSAIHESMILIADEIGAIRKEQQNKDQHYSFRGIDAVTKAFHPLLVKHAVVLLPSLRSIDYAIIPTARGTNMNYARVVVAFQFVHEDGSSVEVVTAGEAFDMQDKATSKAHSVALRTALLQAFTVPTDEPDPDDPVDIPVPGARHDADAARFVELQEEIKAKWATVWEWDEQVVANYYTQTMGGDLYSATVPHLERFLAAVTKAADEALSSKGTES